MTIIEKYAGDGMIDSNNVRDVFFYSVTSALLECEDLDQLSGYLRAVSTQAENSDEYNLLFKLADFVLDPVNVVD